MKQLDRSRDVITHLPSSAGNVTPQPKVARHRQTTRRRSAASPAMVRDVWVYRIVVSAFAAVLLIGRSGPCCRSPARRFRRCPARSSSRSLPAPSARSRACWPPPRKAESSWPGSDRPRPVTSHPGRNRAPSHRGQWPTSCERRCSEEVLHGHHHTDRSCRILSIRHPEQTSQNSILTGTWVNKGKKRESGQSEGPVPLVSALRRSPSASRSPTGK